MYIAGAAFIALFLFGLPFPLVILIAGAVGWFVARRAMTSSAAGEQSPSLGSAPKIDVPPLHKRAVGLLCGLAIWQIPFALIWIFAAPETLAQLQTFFSKMAVVTFGGAYAVLAYVAQIAVETHGWMTAGEMLDGLALSEATPGPLVLVLSYIGFLAAFRNPGLLDPLLAGVMGASVAAWATFVPSFIFIFLGAPYMESARHNRRLSAALSAITAAVVGVILNLSVWFGLHVLFRDVERVALVPVINLNLSVPVWNTLDPVALALFVASTLMLFRFKLGMVPVLALCIAAGFARLWVGG